jgi:hypothetical protein
MPGDLHAAVHWATVGTFVLAIFLHATKALGMPHRSLIFSRQHRKIPPSPQSEVRGFAAFAWDLGMNDDNHRVAARHRVLKGARIEFGNSVFDCTIRNLSDTGAALDVSPVGLPAEFTLVADGFRRSCKVVWRKEKRIGVTFGKA